MGLELERDSKAEQCNTKATRSGDQMCLITSVGVPDQEQWYTWFREHDQFHKMHCGVTYSHVSFYERDGQKRVQVIYVFPKECEETVRRKKDYTGGPFPELKKQGIILEPLESCYWNIVSVAAPGEHLKKESEKRVVLPLDGEVCFTASHQVPDFENWYKNYLEQDHAGFHSKLGITKSMVSKSHGCNGKTMIHVVHFLPKDMLNEAQAAFNFTGPPFVGGPDLIANGIVMEPISSQFSCLKKVDFCCLEISHCVPDHDTWFKTLTADRKFREELGITQTIPTYSSQKKNGKPWVKVMYIFPKGREAAVRKATKNLTVPPFEEDKHKNTEWNKDGAILEPIERYFSACHCPDGARKPAQCPDWYKICQDPDNKLCAATKAGSACPHCCKSTSRTYTTKRGSQQDDCPLMCAW